jgi:hypothetical protein
MEEEGPDEMEVAEKKNEERAKEEVSIKPLLFFYEKTKTPPI